MSEGKPYGRRACFVPGCRTGYPSEKKHRKKLGESNLSLFKAPKDSKNLELWQQTIPRGDKPIASHDAVCELHFREQDVLKYDETKLRDGTISRIKRERARLKHGAIPCIFPNLALFFPTTNDSSRSTCNQIELVDENGQILLDPLADNSHIIEEMAVDRNDDDDASVVDEENQAFESFNNLKDNMHLISTPNEQWSSTFIPGKNVVIFAKWDDTYTPKKKIVLHKDMTFKIFFQKTEIFLAEKGAKISRLQELEDLIKSINSMPICAGTQLTSASECCTGIAPVRIHGRKGNTCSPCKMEHARKKKKS